MEIDMKKACVKLREMEPNDDLRFLKFLMFVSNSVILVFLGLIVISRSFVKSLPILTDLLPILRDLLPMLRDLLTVLAPIGLYVLALCLGYLYLVRYTLVIDDAKVVFARMLKEALKDDHKNFKKEENIYNKDYKNLKKEVDKYNEERKIWEKERAKHKEDLIEREAKHKEDLQKLEAARECIELYRHAIGSMVKTS